MRVKSCNVPGIFIGLVLWFGCGLAVRAGTWTLANGDRLTGELVSEDAQFIEVRHPQLGLLKMPRAALLPAVEIRQKSEGLPLGVVSLNPAESKGTADPETPKKWKRQLEVGYVQQAGAKDKLDLAIRGQVDGREGANTFRATGRLLRSETDGQVAADRREGEFRWRHDINKRLFAQSLTTYEEDDVRNIDLNLEQQFGGGYRVVDVERHKATVGLGAVLQYLQRETTEAQTALLGTVFQDYSYQLNSRLKLVQESSFMLSNRGTLNVRSGVVSAPADGSYRLKFNTGLQSKVNNHMSLNVRFEYDYDRSVLESDLRADQRLTTSLGYLW